MRLLRVTVALCSLAARASGSDGYCNDKSTSCAAWAKDGECSGKNAEYLSVLCPHSCGTCTLTCSDTDQSCANWAKQGDCQSNAGFMLKTCPTSCGLCTPTCKDVHEDCTGWTAAGACGDNVSGPRRDGTRARRPMRCARGVTRGV
jgi:hypothetical protein